MGLLASQQAAAEVPVLVVRTLASLQIELQVLERAAEHITDEAERARLEAFVTEVRLAYAKLEQ